MRSTLYLKFISIYLIFGFLCLFTVATLTHELTISELEEDTSDTLYKEATLLANDYLTGYFTDDLTLSDIHTQLNGMSTYLHASTWFIDRTGQVILSAGADEMPVPPSEIPDFDPAENGSSKYLLGTYHDLFDKKVITVIAPVTQGFTTKGYLLLHKPYEDLEQQTSSLLRNVYITIVVIYILSFCILLAFHFFIYQPLRKITEAATQYASGNLTYEIPVRTEDEMGYLSASLNYMAAQLKDMEDYQKKFIANVSHDFRSPLTSIKGYVEAIVDGTIPQELQGKYLNIILFETERLTDLTKDLLTLNEFDTKDLLLDKTNFNLHDTIKHTAASFEGTCTSKKISIELLFDPRIQNVFADRGKIQQVLYNLLDNAIKFSNPDSSIVLETTERNGKVFVSVKDSGIGIPKKSLTKVWERFYKSDLSRGKDKKGTGLGSSRKSFRHMEKISTLSAPKESAQNLFSHSQKAVKISFFLTRKETIQKKRNTFPPLKCRFSFLMICISICIDYSFICF